MNRFATTLAGTLALLFLGATTLPAHSQTRAALIRDVDRPTAQPVHASCTTPGSPLRNKCSLYVVPAGKVLVVQTVSYEVQNLSYQEPSEIMFFHDASGSPLGLARGDNFILLTPALASTPGNRIYQATQAVTMYLDENQVFAGGAGTGTSFPLAFTFAFQGYLVDK